MASVVALSDVCSVDKDFMMRVYCLDTDVLETWECVVARLITAGIEFFNLIAGSVFCGFFFNIWIVQSTYRLIPFIV